MPRTTNPLLGIFSFLTLFFIGISNVSATEACNNTTATCEAMCAHVYDTCTMSFKNSSSVAMSETACITACASTSPDVVSCLTTITCNLEAIDSCLVNATASSGSGTGSTGTYIGGGGVTDAAGSTANSGACGTITDCNSCVTNCRCRYGGTAAEGTCCTGCGCECELYCVPTEWWIATCM